MKILILLPNGSINKLKISGLVDISFREAPLTATFLAALVPKELNFEITICDESVQKVPSATKFDLVAISIITGTANRGYRWASHFRNMGAAVVIGGVHATLLPEEAKLHADSIMIGFAEISFPQMCRDFVKGELKPVYQQECSDLVGIPWARRDLQKRFGYMMPNTVFATRGCKNTCDFCAAVGAKFGWSTRPVGEVIDEIASLPGNRFAFNDISLCEDPEYTMELCAALKPLKKKWGGLMTTKATSDERLMDALAESGCRYMLLGFESVMQRSLYDMKKGFNQAGHYHKVCAALHDRKMLIQGCFIFGLDGETQSIFDETIDAVNDLQIDIPRFALYTPFPNTGAYARIKSEQRLLHENWDYYDTQHVVIRPTDMSVGELDLGFKHVWNSIYSLKSIRHRTSVKRGMYTVACAGNLAYRIYLKRLNNDTNRFYNPSEV